MRLSFAGVAASLFLIGAVAASPAGAAILEIQFTGVDLVYANGQLTDAANANTLGVGAPADADPLTTMVFLVDGVQQGTLTSTIAIDTYIAGLTGIPATGGSVWTSGNGNNFGVDLLTKPATPAWGLGLNIDKFNFFYSGFSIAIATSGQSTAVTAQALPFGLAFDTSQPISIVLSSANLTNVTVSDGVVTGFRAAGTGNISGVLLPEPSTLLLVALGGLAVLRRRGA